MELTKGVWLTWEKQRRNKGMSDALGWELHEILCEGGCVQRYITSFLRTVKILLRNKPEFVAAQNPSLLLALVVVLLKFLFGYVSIIDAHNAGVFPLEGRSKILCAISKIIQLLADVTVVTNKELANVVVKNGGRAFVLPDRLPEVPRGIYPFSFEAKFNFAFVCSFNPDEPFNEVVEAVKRLPDDICVYVTGRYPKGISRDELPKNLVLLGFIPDNDYWSLISSVDAIIVLTTRENCLVCGAYEGVALNKPMVLSDTSIMREYFSAGVEYAFPTADAVKEAILTVIEKKEKLQREVSDLKCRLGERWDSMITDFKSYLTSIPERS
ncbi:glycosyltransferase [Geomonas paludis]|uniref:Glycosyl transferase n=1 Tax=Geomonas paludis TaxID=2740185 RepID=A0A6V8MUK0_9BACT|nr:glycosyltransferase [Geomonas paludis]GFO63691.1 glycosyl transferase [Geomonas paludis]